MFEIGSGLKVMRRFFFLSLAIFLLVFGNSICWAYALTITGPDEVASVAQFSVTGGNGPYSWCITKGSITQSGLATVSGNCGSATIMAADARGVSATKVIRIGGSSTWVMTGTINSPAFYCAGSGCPCTGGCSWVWGCIVPQAHAEEIFGNAKRVGGLWTCSSSNERSCLTWSGPPPAGYSCSSSDVQLVSYITTYEWKCNDGSNGTENVCNPPPCIDADGDGHYAVSDTCPKGDDIDDGDPTKHPSESCDSKDNNDNDVVDEGCWGKGCLNVSN